MGLFLRGLIFGGGAYFWDEIKVGKGVGPIIKGYYSRILLFYVLYEPKNGKIRQIVFKTQIDSIIIYHYKNICVYIKSITSVF